MTRNPSTSGSHLQLEFGPLTFSRKLCVCTHPHDGQICATDIEKCQRSELLAGADPLLFSPERWQDIKLRVAKLNTNKEGGSKRRLKDEEESLGFMPFAFHCPSSKGRTLGFGFKMIRLWSQPCVQELTKNGS
jgi:hypothetical protein